MFENNDDKYIKGETLGVGTFASVVKATVKSSGQEVAIKKVRIASAKEGIDVTALREIKVLRELHHPHVIQLVDVFTSSNQNLSIVLELMDSDLEAVIKDTSLILSQADIKSYMKMALDGLATCHAHNVVHRDIKPNNLLTSKTGLLKLADFGMAKVYGSPEGCRTSQVFARWYRAPELLWGSTSYGPAVDVWAMGCVFAELMLRRPWFVAESDIKQMQEIFAVLGTPSEDQWQGMRDLPSYIQFSPAPAQPLHKIFTQANEDALDLLACMVCFDPSERITAADALNHNYFRKGVKPTPPERLPKPKSRSDAPLLPPSQTGVAPVGKTTPPRNSGEHVLGAQDQTRPVDSVLKRRLSTSSTCLDNIVNVVYGRHARHAQPLPSGSKGSYGSVSWSPAQSLSVYTDSGLSGVEHSCTPCSHGNRAQGGLRKGSTSGHRQVCAADLCMASRLQPPAGRAAKRSCGWQPLSGSHAASPRAQTGDSSWMLSPLDMCACVSERKDKDAEENCSSLQNSPAGVIMRVARTSSGCAEPDHSVRGSGQGLFMRQLDLLAPGAAAVAAGTPSLWPGKRRPSINTMSTAQLTDDQTPRSAALVDQQCIPEEAAMQGGQDIALNPLSMFCATGTSGDGVSAVPTPVKAKLRRNLFGPD